MNGRRVAIVLLPVVLACTDSTAPGSRAAEARPLPLPEYALQLRGDPFLQNVSSLLGKPQLVDAIDAAVGGLDQSRSSVSVLTTQSIQTARLALDVVGAADSAGVVTESDILNAVMTTTLERIEQVNEEAAASNPASNPPPTR